MSGRIICKNKNLCCGCMVCKDTCPKKAIEYVNGEDGFIYPTFNKKCIECNICAKVCPIVNYKNSKYNEPDCYAAQIKDNISLLNSSSGGIYYELAKKIIEDGGVVYGAAQLYEKEELVVKHIRVTNKLELKQTQGSKYIQSKTENIYETVKKDLKDKKVLFSGTPCQVHALKLFLRKDYDNLITIDIICHGVPSNKMFNDYIKLIEKKKNIKIINFNFRNKKKGWGHLINYDFIDKKNRIKNKSFNASFSSYFKYFINGYIYRDTCYECKYASSNRIGDITLGDFWGIEKEYPNTLKKNGGCFDNKGISAVIINNTKGRIYFDSIKNRIYYYKVSFDKIAKHNNQLISHSRKTKNREDIMNLYQKFGYEAVEHKFKQEIKFKKYIYFAASCFPFSLRNRINKIIRRKK